MYQYDQYDQQMVDDRVTHYREQTRRYLAGELEEDRFRPLRLKNGLYIQRLAPMLRVAIPYGSLSSRQLRMLAHIARHYDKGYGHFTTRQNIQFNWPLLEEVPDILADLATVQMHAIQTSGNCIRNVTADQFSGATPDEFVDARPWCELIRQWSSFHPEFDWLPRKFKIAVNGSKLDRAATMVHDIGLDARRDANGDVVFDVKVGGGLGRTPVIASVIREGLPSQHLLTYLAAVMRVYNRYGRRDNKYKARIKILVRAMSPDGFRDRVEAEWAHLKDGLETLTPDEIERVHDRFVTPGFEQLEDRPAVLTTSLADDAEFARWHAHNVHAHQQPGYASVTLSLKRTGVAPGDATDVQMDAVADWADAYGHGEVRVTHEQNLILPHVRQQDLYVLWQAATRERLATANAGTLNDLICCPGGDFCSLANAKSIPIAEAIQQRFNDLDRLYDLGPIYLNISGCMNACGHHHVGHIGILGVDKKGQEFYQISIGGDATNNAAIAQILGPSFEREQVPDVIEQIIDLYVEQRREGEHFIDCVRRTGIEPFKERIYASPDQG
ncbi:MAG: nitrite/sulfite reductase [Gammaproteobacteria bacterium]|nr:MAG: nitrite/sulfite reductase [Gammaproteobacteria bacterium]